MTDLAADVTRDLTRRLALLGGSSAALGAVAAASRTPAMRAFGRQTAGWGLVDVGIAAVSLFRAEPVPAARLRRLLLLNAWLDVGYVLAGAYIVARRPSFGGRASSEEAAGHGLAVIVQGAALLVLDVGHVRRLAG